MNKPFTTQEDEIIDLLTQAHNKFEELTQMHPNEGREWVNGMHALTNVLGWRVLRRDYPEEFRSSAPVDEVEKTLVIRSVEKLYNQDDGCEWFKVQTSKGAYVMQGGVDENVHSVALQIYEAIPDGSWRRLVNKEYSREIVTLIQLYIQKNYERLLKSDRKTVTLRLSWQQQNDPQ